VPPPSGPAGEAADDDWAICCSGGGIRSAAYCLGALQALDEHQLLAKVKWILGVSGGSYIASSRALVAHDLPPGTTHRAYAPGTPEERNLRHNTRYIAPDASVVLAGLLSLLFGVIMTFIMVSAPLYALAHAWGWLLRGQHVLVPAGGHELTATVTATSWWLATVIAAGITLALFLLWWLTLAPGDYRGSSRWYSSLKPDDRDPAANRARLVSWAAALTAALGLAMLAAPWLVGWLTRSTGPLGTIAHFAGFGARPTWSWPALVAVLAAVTAVARFCQTGLAKWNSMTQATASAPGPAKGATPSQPAAKPGLFAQLAGWLRQKLLPWLASAIVVLLGAVLALLWTGDGARAGYSAAQLVPVLVALGVVLLTRALANVNRLSMHDFYRWRLANAYAVTRRAAEARNPLRARKLFTEAAATRLSQLQPRAGDPEPELVICGTANINAVREVPPGRGGCCVTFDPQYVTLHREIGLAAPEPAQARMSDYETLVGRRWFTLFDVSAVSGAAISPLMGSATRHAYRILLTATNVRLGVWLPHPALVRAARDLLDHPARRAAAAAKDRPWTRRPLLLLLWYLSPHPLWDRRADRNFDREARLWAHVLSCRESGGRRSEFWYRVMQPTLGLLWAEAGGQLSYRSTWMYVTDGGHYDNLGLVEALRRGAKNVVVLDASGDKPNSWFTLGGAIALARADAGVEITLTPSDMIRPGSRLAAGEVTQPWTHGTFSRPARPAAVPGDAEQQPVPSEGRNPCLPSEGQIWVCKLGWWSGAPWDVQAYARSHASYPCDPTLEQLYDAAEFEAYHKLGQAAASAAITQGRPPLRWMPAPASPMPQAAADSGPAPGISV
jgi:Patatin-like phospholipase